MENQDIFNQFKKAADNAESPDFASMEKVWQRVEVKLDQKVLKKESNLWKKIAVAASLLLMGTLGYQFLKKEQPTINTNDSVVSKDTIQNIGTPNQNAVVAAETVHPDIKKDAAVILKEQIITDKQVAVQEPIPVAEHPSETIAEADKESAKLTEDEVAPSNHGYLEPNKVAAKSVRSKDLELFVNKENKVSNAKKEMPLLVYDNLETNKQTVKEVDMDEIESIIVLPDPLYIINGVEYTEQELFGPNPTSPYAPLNQQEIDSISVLQNEKAISIYGQKGKKGVVIISTKNGKPAAKKRK